MRRRWAVVAVVVSLVAVACSRLYVEAPAGGVAVPGGEPLSTVFLIGDFGRPGPPLEDLVDAISGDVTDAAEASRRTAPLILELGDNLYEEGLPRDLNAPGADAEVAKLRAIAAQFARISHGGRQVPVALIPGNHDYDDNALLTENNRGDISRWYFLDELGIDGASAWTHVPGDASRFDSSADLFAHLEGDPAARVSFMEPMPVPGLDAGLWVVALDSELILDLYAEGYEQLAADYWESLDRVLAASPAGSWLMIAAHHPPVTYGKHGPPSAGNWVFGQGWPQFPKAWQKALAFATPLGVVLGIVIHPAALALAVAPPLATVFASGRQQDVGSPVYDRYADELLRLAAVHDVDAVLAGHDHNTQIIELSAIDGFAGDTILVISGAGSKVDPVRRGAGTVAYLANYSYVRMIQYVGGVSFEIVDRQGGTRFRYGLSR